MIFILILSQHVFADINQNHKIMTSIKIAETFSYDENLTIPKSFKHGIKAVAIIPDTIKTGFLVAYQEGTGIFSIKNNDGKWSSPLFVNFRGLGIGAQIGYQSGDLVFLFRNHRSYSGLFSGTHTIDFGGDVSVAGGGYSKSFLTDLPEISADVVALGRSNGYFAGISIDGSKLKISDQDTIDYYQRLYRAEDIIKNSPKMTPLTQKLLNILEATF